MGKKLVSIKKANRGIPNRLNVMVYGLEVGFDNCSFTHNSVILKVGNNITGRIYWVSEKQEFLFREEIEKFNIEDNISDIIIKNQQFG